MTNRNKIIAAVLALIAAYGVGYFTGPTKTKVEVVKQEVVKENQEQSKTKVVYKEKIVYKDGTVKEIEQVSEGEQSKSSSERETTEITKKTSTKDRGLTVQALALSNKINFSDDIQYGGLVKARVAGNISATFLATTNGKDSTFGIAAGLDF
jgi:hypothetical protein